MDDYLSKPIRMKMLAEVLSRCRPLTNKSTNGKSEIGGSKIQKLEAIDPAALDRMLEDIGGESTLLVELIESFLAETAALLVRMRSAVENNETAEVLRTAHTIKSSSKDFGATTLAGLCQHLEEKSRIGVVENGAELVTQIKTEFEQVKVTLQRVKDDYKPVFTTVSV